MFGAKQKKSTNILDIEAQLTFTSSGQRVQTLTSYITIYQCLLVALLRSST